MTQRRFHASRRLFFFGYCFPFFLKFKCHYFIKFIIYNFVLIRSSSVFLFFIILFIMSKKKFFFFFSRIYLFISHVEINY